MPFSRAGRRSLSIPAHSADRQPSWWATNVEVRKGTACGESQLVLSLGVFILEPPVEGLFVMGSGLDEVKGFLAHHPENFMFHTTQAPGLTREQIDHCDSHLPFAKLWLSSCRAVIGGSKRMGEDQG